MSQTLAALTSRLQADVPSRNSVPSSAQYTQAIKDAVDDFNQRCRRVKIAELAMVSGTATYDLPSDFVILIRMEALASPDGIIISDGGLIPVSATYEEKWTISDGQITFYPTPSYNLTRDFEYGAGHVLSGEEESQAYSEMSNAEAAVIMLKAQALALRLVGKAARREAFQYAIGDERINKEKLAEGYSLDAAETTKEYLEGVAALIGQLGVVSSYELGVRS